jgi:hypothetical protein
VNETQLQIVITAVNDAADALQSVQTSLTELSQGASDAATGMTDSLSAAEESIANQAQQVADAWGTAAESIDSDFEEIVPTTDELIQALVETNQQAAALVQTAWQASSTAMENDLAAALASVDEDTTATMEDMTTKVQSGTISMHGYFRALIAGYSLERVGQDMIGMVEDVVSAAAGVPDQIAQITAQIDQQRASIQVNEAALEKWNGTTAEVNAAHEKAAANIEAEKVKIQELTLQLTPLLAAQQAAGKSVQDYQTSVANLNIAWQTFMATAGAPLLELLAKLFDGIDAVVRQITAWDAIHPKITEAVLIFIGVLGGILTVIGGIIIAVALIIVSFGVLATAIGAAWVAVGAVVAVAVAALVALFVTNWSSIKTATDQFINDVKSAFTAFQTWWGTFWDGIFSALQSAWNKIEAIINAIKSAVSAVGSAVSGIAGAVGGTVGNVVGTAIHAFASGGIVNSPTLALVGEAGPEAIIPLSAFTGGTSLSGTAGFGGGGNIVVNINGGSYLDQNGANQIAAALATQIGRQLKLKNFV